MPPVAASFKLMGDALPEDAYAVRFEASEAISRPYSILVDFSTDDASFRADALLRTRLSLIVEGPRGEARYFDGIADRADLLHVAGARLFFRVRLRPALAALEHREDCRLFQSQSAPDVVRAIFAEAGFSDKVKWLLAKDYEPRELIAQYRETAFNFVSRLLEEHGIFYFFRHSADGHSMILGDDPSAFAPEEGSEPLVLSLAQEAGPGAVPLERFSRRRSLRASAVHLRDYDFEKPQVKPDAVIPAREAWPLIHYEHPGRFTRSAEGSLLAAARLSELRRDADIVRGASRAIGLACGVPFVVTGAAEDALNGEFVLTEMTTTGVQNPEAGVGSNACSNEFIGIPQNAPFAPPRRARRPRIRGIQTAVVTGPSSEEQAIYCDKYGRIKVRFRWDRINQQNETSSPWIRVSQIPLGGSMILPRVGWEVSVAFLDGDPDRPLVLGRLYNAEKTPPYALPGTKASGSIKSMSSPGGAGSNEIIMADSSGSQGFGVHAQKDLNILIGHNKVEEIGVDEAHSITVNESVSIGADESISVGGNQAVDVGAVHSQKISGGESITIGGNDTSNATANYVENIGGSRSYTVGGNQTTISNGIRVSVDGDLSRTVGAVEVIGSVGSISDEIGGNVTSTAGAVTLHLMKGVHAETIAGSKNQTSAAAELHLIKGNMDASCDATVTNLIGGLHYEKVAGDYSVKAPIVALIGAVGTFQGGGSSLKLGGGPVVVKGSKISIKTALLVKLGASLKMGS